MHRAPVEDRVTPAHRDRILDWDGWVPGQHPDLAPGPEVRLMIETAPYGVSYDLLVELASNYIRGAGESIVLRRLDKDLVDDRGITIAPAADYF